MSKRSSIKQTHFFNLSGEVAFQQLLQASIINNFRALRLNASWRYRNISSRVTWQNGIFNLNYYSFFHPEDYVEAEWLTQYSLKLHQSKLEASCQLGLYKENFYNNLRTRLVLNISYRPSTDITFNAGVTKLPNFFWQQPEFRIGVVYKPHFLKNSNHKNIRITVFSDKNGDGKKDKDENPTKDLTIMIDNRILKTNDQGTIYVQNIPQGDYTLIIGKGGTSQKISVTQNAEILIPIEETYQLKGKLVIKDDNGISILQANRVIHFRSTEAKDYLVATESNGTFDLRLPKGKYAIIFQDSGDLKLENTTEHSVVIDKDITDLAIKAELKGRRINYTIVALAMQ